MKNTHRKPSIPLSLTMGLLYLFAALPLSIGTFHGLIFAGYSATTLKENSSEIFLVAQIGITSVLIFLLARKYLGYLLSEGWEKDYFRYLKIGFMWAIPVLAWHTLPWLISDFHDKLASGYLSTSLIKVNSASNFTVCLLSISVVLGAIFEEFFYRGILINILKGFLHNWVAVLISASIFALSHFMFSEISIAAFSGHFTLGLLCGFAYNSTGSCISAIVPHLSHNIICAGFVWAFR